MIDAIYSVAAWLREEQHIPPDAARPPQEWRKALKEKWAQRTGTWRSRPYCRRHTADEYRRISAAIGDPRVDPRIPVAIELAAECRTGQVLRCTRGMLTLPEVTPNDYKSAPPGGLGQVEIPGAWKKHGEVVVLTPEQRRAIDDALGGYLANYEAAWRAGQIGDYLFPGLKMRMLDGTARRWTRKVRPNAKPFSRDGARVAFKELEAIAGVQYVEGRGWHGLRRIAAPAEGFGGKNQRPTGSGNGSGQENGPTRSGSAAWKQFTRNEFDRAGDGTRTHDVQLGKLAFYQLNYAREVQVG